MRRTRTTAAFAALAGLLAALAATIGLAQPAAADDVTALVVEQVGSVGSVDVTPYPAASNTGTVNITITGAQTAAAAPLSGAVAVTLCSNHDGAGNPLTPAQAADAANWCDGGDGVSDLGQVVFAIFGGGNGSTSFTLHASGIGFANGQCLPGGNVPCLIGLGDVATAGASFAVGIPIFGGPAPVSTALTAGAEAVREGNSLSFTGVDYTPSGTIASASLCDADGVSNCQALTGVTGTIDGAGALSGSGTVPAGATTGNRRLVVSDGTRSASDTVIVLGTRTITATPPSGGVGTPITIAGTDFDPNQAVIVVPTDGVGPVGPAVNATTSATGTFSAVVPAAAGQVGFAASELDNPTTEFAFVPFVPSANSCTANPTCTINQTIVQEVIGGTLSMSQPAATITMSAITLDGTTQTSSGSLNDVTVNDARGSLTGWTLSGSVTNLTTGIADANHTIVAADVSWTPTCTAGTGLQPEVTTGSAGSIPTNALLCSAASGGGGGTFVADAAIAVEVEPTKAAGIYTGTLTLTLTGN